MAEVREPGDVCSGCDGDGTRMYQLGKTDMLAVGGVRRPLGQGRYGFYYCLADGREIALKTIGGPCSHCRGSGIEPAGEIARG